MNLLLLYFLFAKISLFTFGGGYAMVPLFHSELVTVHSFMEEAEFANLIALAQVTPGPIGLNAATYIGFNQAGFWGAVFCNLGVMTPCFFIALLTALFFSRQKQNPWIQALLVGIRPAVIGLIASAVIFFADTSLFTAPLASLWRGKAGLWGVSWQAILIFAVTIILHLRFKKLNVFLTLALAAFLGWVLYL